MGLSKGLNAIVTQGDLKMITPSDQALFDARPTRSQTCPHCRGCGTVVEAYALAPTERFDGAPANALPAFVVGSFDIFTASEEAVDLAKSASRPVAFEFNGQVVVVREDDGPDKISRAWWKRQYNETPEATFARR
jgi:hypothetical protein